jgi:hypothetical protein
MKVLNLQCSASHRFEGWFASEEDYASQLERGLLECPLCADKAIHKLPSAPRLNLGAAPQESIEEKRPVVAASDEMQAMQSAYLQLARKVMAHTEDVGDRFAEEARKIHYGESEERGIRGKATRAETEALLDEGIGVLPLPLPKGLEGPLQ